MQWQQVEPLQAKLVVAVADDIQDIVVVADAFARAFADAFAADDGHIVAEGAPGQPEHFRPGAAIEERLHGSQWKCLAGIH